MTSIRQHPMAGGTSETEGLVSYVVDGSFPPFLGLDSITNGHKVRYVATDGTQFEEGYGVKSAGPTLTRATILRTSAGDTDKIDWGTGTRTVYIVPDLDTVFEADDGTFVRMLKAPQVESDDDDETTRKFRLWTSAGILYLSVASESPFDHLLRYNAAADTPTLMLDQPVDAAGGLKIGGVATQPPATSAFADQSTAEAGSSTAVVMNPARTANAIAKDTLLIGNRTSASSANYTDEVVVKLTGGGLRRLTVAALDQLMNTPDYDSDEQALNAGPVVLSHGLGTKPRRVRWAMTCTSADAGHAVGDSIMDLAWQTSGDADAGLAVVVNTTQIKFLFKNLRTPQPDNSGPSAIDLSKWTVRLWAWIGGAAP